MITIADLLAVLKLQDDMSAGLVQASANLNAVAAQMTQQLNAITQSANQTAAALAGGGGAGGAGGGGGAAGAAGAAGNAFNQTAYQTTLLGRGMQEAGLFMSGFTAAVVFAGKAVIDFGGDFESTTTKLVSLAGVTKSELEGVKQHILDLAPAVGIGPNALAEAMYTVSSVVQDTATALSILDIAAKGAAAGMGETKDVTAGITAVVNAYGAAEISAARAGDILTKAIRDGGAEAKQLAPVLANVVPFAAKMGVSFEEVGANFATMTKLSIPAGEAITTLASVFAALTRETIRGERALKEVGSSYDEIKRKVREDGLAATLIHLKELFKRNEEGLFAVLGRLEALKNVLGTTGAQAEVYLDEVERMKNSHGELEKAFGAVTKTQKFMWDQLSASVETFWIDLSDSFLPIFKGVISLLQSGIPILKSLADLFNALNENPLGRVLTSVAISVTALVAAIGPLLITMGVLTMSVGNIARGLGLLGYQLTLVRLQAMLLNPVIAGIIAGMIAVGAVIVYFSAEAGKATQSTLELAQAHQEEYEALQKLQTQINTTKTVQENYHDIAQKLIQLSPQYTASLDKEVVKYAEIEKAIKEMTAAKLDDLKISQLALRQQINEISEARAKAAAEQERARQGLDYGSVSRGFSGGPNLEEFTKQKAAVKEFDDKLKMLMQTERELREVLDPVFHAQENVRRETEAASVAAERRTRSALSQAVAEASLLEKVASLTTIQKAAITAAREQGLNAKQTVAELEKEGIAAGVTAEMVMVYTKQKNIATQATKEFNKEASKIQEASAAVQRINSLFKDQASTINLSQEAWAKLAFESGAALSDVHLATGISMGDLRMWKKEIDAVADAQAKLAKDTAVSQGRINVLIEETEALQLRATNETYDGKRAAIDAWVQKELNALNKLTLSYNQYFANLIAIALKAKASRDVIDAEQLRKHDEFIDKMKSEDEKYSEDTLALWDTYYSKLAESRGDSLGAELYQLQANFTRAEALNKKHLDKMLADIEKMTALEADERKKLSDVEKKLYEERAAILKKLFGFEVGLAEDLYKQYMEHRKALIKVNEQLNIMGSIFSAIESNSSGTFRTILSYMSPLVSGIMQFVKGVASIAPNVQGAERAMQMLALTSQLAMAATTMGISVIIGGIAQIFAANAKQTALRKQFIADIKEFGVAIADADKVIKDSQAARGGTVLGSNAKNELLDDLKKIREEVSKLLGDAGDALEKFGGKAPKALQPMIDSLLQSTRLTKEQRELLEGMKGDVSWEAMEEAAARYNIELDKLGVKYHQLKSNDTFDQMFADWTMFSDMNADMDEIVAKMSDKVNEALARAKKFGLQVPEYMRPVLEAMLKAGKLTDEFGNVLTDLEGINFSATIESSMERIAGILEKIYDLFAKISGLPPLNPSAGGEGDQKVNFGFGNPGVTGWGVSPTNNSYFNPSPTININLRNEMDGDVLSEKVFQIMPGVASGYGI